MMPLALIGEGEEAMVRRVGGNTEVQHHLENLGFCLLYTSDAADE